MDANKIRSLCLILILSFSLCLIFNFCIQSGKSAWLSNWAYCISININEGDIDATLSNFPILIYLSNKSGENGQDIAAIFSNLGTSSKKIAVTTDDGTTQCYVEIERWNYVSSNPSYSQAWLWVKVPSISSTANTTLYLYYDSGQSDNTAYVGTPTDDVVHNVWDNNFSGVWHLGESPSGTAPQLNDSTSNANHLTSYGSMTTSDLVDAKIGKGLDLDGSNDYLNRGPQTWNLANVYTIEVWLYFRGIAGNQYAIEPTDNSRTNADIGGWDDTGAWERLKVCNYAGSWLTGSNHTLKQNLWGHFVSIHDGVNNLWKVYANGTIDINATSYTPDLSQSDTYLRIGSWTSSDLSNSIVDEVRFSNVTRSPEWVKATYESSRDHIITFTPDYAGTDYSESHEPKTGFNFFKDAYLFNVTTASVWQTVNLSGYVPYYSSGAILDVHNPTSVSFYYDMRCYGSADDYMIYNKLESLHHNYMLVGINSSAFQVKSQSVSLNLYLRGYTDNSTVTFFQNMIDYTANVTDAWTDTIVNASVPEEATGVILRLVNPVLLAMKQNIRTPGSTDDRVTYNGNVNTTTIAFCGLDNQVFQQKATSFGASKPNTYLVGYTVYPVQFYTNTPQVNLTSTKTWELNNLLQSKFGNDVPATLSYTLAAASGEHIVGSIFNIAYDGTAQSITVRLKRASAGSDKVKCAIYNHTSLGLVGSTPERTLSLTTSFAWYTFPFTTKPNLYTGTEYLLVAFGDYTSKTISMAYTSGSTNQGHDMTQTYDGFPDPLVSPTHNNYNFSIYCTYTSVLQSATPITSVLVEVLNDGTMSQACELRNRDSSTELEASARIPKGSHIFALTGTGFNYTFETWRNSADISVYIMGYCIGIMTSISKILPKYSVSRNSVRMQTDIHNVVLQAILNTIDYAYQIVAYDLVDMEWAGPYTVGGANIPDGHYAPSVSVLPNGSIIVMFAYSPTVAGNLSYWVSQNSLKTEGNLTKVLTQWNTQANETFGGSQRSCYPDPVSFDDRTVIFMRNGSSGDGNMSVATFWQNGTWTIKDVFYMSWDGVENSEHSWYIGSVAKWNDTIYFTYTYTHAWSAEQLFMSIEDDVHLIISQDRGVTWKHWNGTTLTPLFDGRQAKARQSSQETKVCNVWIDQDNRTNILYRYIKPPSWRQQGASWQLRLAISNTTLPSSDAGWDNSTVKDEYGRNIEGVGVGLLDSETNKTALWVGPSVNITNIGYLTKFVQSNTSKFTFESYFRVETYEVFAMTTTYGAISDAAIPFETYTAFSEKGFCGYEKVCSSEKTDFPASENEMWLFKFTVRQSATIDGMTVRENCTGTVDATGRFYMCIYDASWNLKMYKWVGLASSAGTPPRDDWISTEFESFDITAGQTYWLGVSEVDDLQHIFWQDSSTLTNSCVKVSQASPGIPPFDLSSNITYPKTYYNKTASMFLITFKLSINGLWFYPLSVISGPTTSYVKNATLYSKWIDAIGLDTGILYTNVTGSWQITNTTVFDAETVSWHNYTIPANETATCIKFEFLVNNTKGKFGTAGVKYLTIEMRTFSVSGQSIFSYLVNSALYKFRFFVYFGSVTIAFLVYAFALFTRSLSLFGSALLSFVANSFYSEIVFKGLFGFVQINFAINAFTQLTKLISLSGSSSLTYVLNGLFSETQFLSLLGSSAINFLITSWNNIAPTINILNLYGSSSLSFLINSFYSSLRFLTLSGSTTLTFVVNAVATIFGMPTILNLYGAAQLTFTILVTIPTLAIPEQLNTALVLAAFAIIMSIAMPIAIYYSKKREPE